MIELMRILYYLPLEVKIFGLIVYSVAIPIMFWYTLKKYKKYQEYKAKLKQ